MPSNAEHADATQALIEALTDLWETIRARHPDVPEADVVLAEPPHRTKPAWGHLVYTRAEGAHVATELHVDPKWIVGQTAGAEKLAVDVLKRLLDQAAHGIADTRGIKDLVREHRYHNKKFVPLAAEVGLVCHTPPRTGVGFDVEDLADDTLKAYAEHLARLDQALRGPWLPPQAAAPTSTWIAAVCHCKPARRIRIGAAALAEAAPVCPVCTQPYQPASKGTS